VSADKWAAVGVAALAAAGAGTITFYANGPWRKRIVDEITIRNALPEDSHARAVLTTVIERDAERYAHRRSNPGEITRALWLLLGLALLTAVSLTAMIVLLKQQHRSAVTWTIYIALIALIGMIGGFALFRQWWRGSLPPTQYTSPPQPRLVRILNTWRARRQHDTVAAFPDETTKDADDNL